MLVHNYTSRDFFATHLTSSSRVLNAGSKSTRYGDNCLNVDVQAAVGVDLVCDIHELPANVGLFDAVICTAVLQYCRNPFAVADQFRSVLRPGGLLYVDAPWIQGYCPDTPDRWRFSQDGLREVFRGFDILESGPSIKPGSALAYLAFQVAEDATSNRYVNFALRHAARLALWPLRKLDTAAPYKLAGANYLIGRKPL